MLLKPAEKQTAYLKAGILGFAGSGKTFTATGIAIGLQERIGSKKPIAFFDTETGSDHVLDKFKKAGMELHTAKTRAFSDLLTVVGEASKTCDILIIDSISHVWTELLEAYQRKHNLKRLLFHHWGPIKSEWRQFTDLYLTSSLHIIMCGRAGWEYDYEENEDGTKELVKTGTKMRAETEMSYEPSLLLEMDRIKNADGTKGKWLHRCYVLKDRSDLINGHVFDNPTFKDFEPTINTLNLGGKHHVLDTGRTSDDMIDKPDYSAEDRKRLRKVYTEEIVEAMRSALPGKSDKEITRKADMLQVVFNTRSWTGVQNLPPDILQYGRDDIEYLCEAVSNQPVVPKDKAFKPYLETTLRARRSNEPDDIPDATCTENPDTCKHDLRDNNTGQIGCDITMKNCKYKMKGPREAPE